MGRKTCSNTGPLPLPPPLPLLPWAVVVHLENTLATGGAVVAAVRLDALAVEAPPHPTLPGEGVHGQALGRVSQDALLIHSLHTISTWILVGYHLMQQHNRKRAQCPSLPSRPTSCAMLSMVSGASLNLDGGGLWRQTMARTYVLTWRARITWPTTSRSTGGAEGTQTDPLTVHAINSHRRPDGVRTSYSNGFVWQPWERRRACQTRHKRREACEDQPGPGNAKTTNTQT